MPRNAQLSKGLHLSQPVNENRAIPLAGVPQIPDDVERTIRIMGEWALTDEQIARAKAAVADAKLELNRRIVAQKSGMKLEQYFAFTPEQSHGQHLNRLSAARQKAREDAEGCEVEEC